METEDSGLIPQESLPEVKIDNSGLITKDNMLEIVKELHFRVCQYEKKIDLLVKEDYEESLSLFLSKQLVQDLEDLGIINDIAKIKAYLKKQYLEQKEKQTQQTEVKE